MRKIKHLPLLHIYEIERLTTPRPSTAIKNLAKTVPLANTQRCVHICETCEIVPELVVCPGNGQSGYIG